MKRTLIYFTLCLAVLLAWAIYISSRLFPGGR